jgi:hypothetical protein
MRNNKPLTNENALDVAVIGKAQKRVLQAYARLRTWRATAAEFGVHYRYVWDLGMHGIAPKNTDLRARLGLPRVLPSERKARVKRILPLLGSDGWQDVFFKKLRIKKWKTVK